MQQLSHSSSVTRSLFREHTGVHIQRKTVPKPTPVVKCQAGKPTPVVKCQAGKPTPVVKCQAGIAVTNDDGEASTGRSNPVIYNCARQLCVKFNVRTHVSSASYSVYSSSRLKQQQTNKQGTATKYSFFGDHRSGVFKQQYLPLPPRTRTTRKKKRKRKKTTTWNRPIQDKNG